MSTFALDLGSRTTRLARDSDPPLLIDSVAAVDLDRDRVIAIGDEARTEALRVGARACLVSVVDHGTPRSARTLEGFLAQALRALGLRSFGRGTVRIAVPQLATTVERRALVRVLENLGAASVRTLAPSLAALRAHDADVDAGAFCLVVGEGYTESGIAALGSLCESAGAKLGLSALRQAIREVLWSSYELVVSDHVAHEILVELCDVAQPTAPTRARVWGRRRDDGSSASVVIEAAELVAAMEPTLRAIESLTRSVLQRASAQLVADVAESGLLLAGGGALVPGLAQRLATALRLDVRRAHDPLGSVLGGLRVASTRPRHDAAGATR